MNERIVGELTPPERTLLGPGPANISPRVHRAMTTPLLGHLDPAFLAIMDETVHMLRTVFRTSNKLTIPVSGTGSAGMEAALCNVIEPGDTIVVGVHGYFGERITDMASRYGAKVVRVEAEWGKPLDPAHIKAALQKEKKVKVVAIVHAETSTGVLTPLPEIARMTHEHDGLFLIDTVTSLGGCDVRMDEWDIDIAYSGTQKCIGAPPGLAPITFSARALNVLSNRKTKVANWYLDLSALDKYWGVERNYHHTAPITMVYALREALRLVLEEGLDKRHARHAHIASAFRAGVQAMGLGLLAPVGYRLNQLTSVQIPQGVDDMAIRGALLNEFNIEVGGGLGPLKSKIWRVGLMGYNATPKNVLMLLSALETLLPRQGFKPPVGAGVAAAQTVLNG